MKNLSPHEVQLLISSESPPLLLDVREAWEYDLCHLKDSLNIPMNTIPEKINTIDRSKVIVCICHHGMRSLQVAYFLEQQGFAQVVNLQGGVDAWAQELDQNMPRY